MSRLLRILWGTLLVLSTLLCLTTAALWMRSYRVADAFSHARHDYAPDGANLRRFVSIKSSRGNVIAGHGHFTSLLFRSTTIKEGFSSAHETPTQSAPPPRTIVWSLLGVQYTRIDSPGMLVSHALWIPHWLLTAAFAVAPAVWIFKRQRQAARSATNRCPNCGYDMRATPNRCPECGQRPTTATPKPATPANS
jgi:hypothetical protein